MHTTTMKGQRGDDMSADNKLDSIPNTNGQRSYSALDSLLGRKSADISKVLLSIMLVGDERTKAKVLQSDDPIRMVAKALDD